MDQYSCFTTSFYFKSKDFLSPLPDYVLHVPLRFAHSFSFSLVDSFLRLFPVSLLPPSLSLFHLLLSRPWTMSNFYKLTISLLFSKVLALCLLFLNALSSISTILLWVGLPSATFLVSGAAGRCSHVPQ